MKPAKISKKFLFCLMLATVVVITATRGITLTYNRQLHPDEHVFYLGANSMVNALLHPGMEFQEYMEYPEGSYAFHAVFQLAGKLFSTLTGMEHDLQIWGRIASVFYFTAAVLLGIHIVAQYLGRSKQAAFLYALTMSFSLFFIEQSRYGTGDMISLMLLMLLIRIVANAVSSSYGTRWWIAAFFICGVLGAVKYPLLVFLILPIGAYLHRHLSRKQQNILPLIGYAAVCLGAFLLFSPKGMQDPGYFLRVIQREGSAYVTSGTSHEAGGLLNHFLVMLLYSLLYSDIPLLLPFTLKGFFRSTDGDQPAEQTETEFLFRFLLPGICLLFFGYNLLARSLFFRTYTPFYGIIVLYTSKLAGNLLNRKGVGRLAVVCLCAVMVVRGGSLILSLTDHQSVSDKVAAQIESAVDDSWSETYITSMFSLYASPEDLENRPVYSSSDLSLLLTRNNQESEIQPGQLVVTGAYGWHLGMRYLCSEPDEAVVWNAFREANRQYLVGQAYPEWYSPMFGFWLRGGTLSQYEFPVNYIYYRK